MKLSDFWIYRLWKGGVWYCQSGSWSQNYSIYDAKEDHRSEAEFYAEAMRPEAKALVDEEFKKAFVVLDDVISEEELQDLATMREHQEKERRFQLNKRIHEADLKRRNM